MDDTSNIDPSILDQLFHNGGLDPAVAARLAGKGLGYGASQLYDAGKVVAGRFDGVGNNLADSLGQTASYFVPPNGPSSSAVAAAPSPVPAVAGPDAGPQMSIDPSLPNSYSSQPQSGLPGAAPASPAPTQASPTRHRATVAPGVGNMDFGYQQGPGGASSVPSNVTLANAPDSLVQAHAAQHADDSPGDDNTSSMLAALRGDSWWAQLAAATGDPALAPYGRAAMAANTEQFKNLSEDKRAYLDRILRKQQVNQEGQSAVWTHEHQQGELAHGGAELAEKTQNDAETRRLQKEQIEKEKYVFGPPGSMRMNNATGEITGGTGVPLDPKTRAAGLALVNAQPMIAELANRHAAIGASAYTPGSWGAKEAYNKYAADNGPAILQPTTPRGSVRLKPEAAFPDPSTSRENAQAAFGRLMQDNKAALKEWEATARVRGNPAEIDAILSGSGGTGAGAQMHKVIPPGASTHVMIPESDLAAAIAAGGKQVD